MRIKEGDIFVRLSGGQMSGELVITADPSLDVRGVVRNTGAAYSGFLPVNEQIIALGVTYRATLEGIDYVGVPNQGNTGYQGTRYSRRRLTHMSDADVSSSYGYLYFYDDGTDRLLGMRYNDGTVMRPVMPEHMRIRRKTAEESVTNTTTLQNDDHLFFAALANEVWYIELLIGLFSPAAADIKFNFSIPAGATVISFSLTSDLGTGGGLQVSGAVGEHFKATTGANQVVHYRVYLRMGATAGNFQLQWAQFAADLGTTAVLESSSLIAHRVA